MKSTEEKKNTERSCRPKWMTVKRYQISPNWSIDSIQSQWIRFLCVCAENDKLILK